MNVSVQIYTEFNHEHGLPAYESLGAAGMDVRCNERVVLEPNECKLIRTGLFMAVPEGYEIQVRPRSGMSLKTRLRIANSPGTIDSDFRGEICIIAENTHDYCSMSLGLGERIAQIVLQEVPKIEWGVVGSNEALGNTVRGIGGFGSTSLK